MNVPTKANVKMTPKLRKKFSCEIENRRRCKSQQRISDKDGSASTYLLELIAGVENNGREKHVEEQGMFESLEKEMFERDRGVLEDEND